MREEVTIAVGFLTRLIQLNDSENQINKEQLEVFKQRLISLLCEQFNNHWFPDKPDRGQGYRCIRLNRINRKDPIIAEAARQCGLTYERLRLPVELTVWVDPKSVACRFGEHDGSFCDLSTFNAESADMVLEDVDLDEIYKKSIQLREKVVHEMSTRKNGRRGFLSGSSPNGKGSRGNGHLHSRRVESPNPIAVNWYNSVNSSASNSNSNSITSDVFSSSPPNPYSIYTLAKFSPPKYGYGTSSKWSTSATHPSYGSSAKTDKYHWFNGTKPTIKA